MPSAYSLQGVQFDIPDLWSVSEDDCDKTIRAITLETPFEATCMIDLYKKEHAPSLDWYIDNQIKYFIKALPFGYKIVEGPKKSLDRALRRGQEIFGHTVKMKIRTIFFSRTDDFNYFYHIELERYSAMISLRGPEHAMSELRSGFLCVLDSFHAE